MIGSIRGKVINIEGLTLLLEANSGIGYEVEIPGSLLANIKLGEECFLYTQHIVREDAELLYGFNSVESRLLFREVIKINGVGPRVGMALLSTFDLHSFIQAVREERITALCATPGIGKKTAERIIVEMKDRLDKLRLLDQAQQGSPSASTEGAGPLLEAPVSNSFVQEDAIAALLSLGYKENIAMTTVKQAFEPGLDTQQLIVKALALLSKR